MSQEPDNKALQDFSSYSSIDLINQRKDEELRKRQIAEEDLQEYKKCLNHICSTPEGQFVFRKIIRYTELFLFDKTINAAKLVEDKGKQKVYLEFIRPFLTPEIRKELESEV